MLGSHARVACVAAVFLRHCILCASVLLGACYASHGRSEAEEPPEPAPEVEASVCGDPAARQRAQEVCDYSVRDPDRRCPESGRKAVYQSCERGIDICGDDPDIKCAATTGDPENLFCAPYCETDADCPTFRGYAAACNLAWCALLCKRGECPDGMRCVPEFPFLDCIGGDRGTRSICVPEP